MTKQRRAPRNTAKETKENPILFMAAAMGKGNASEAIREQEAEGQQSFVNSDTLPTDIDPDSKRILKKAGVKFLGPVKDDALFQYVELPAGWKKVPTDHEMWSDLVDDQGRKRAGMFYKAAFYDRSAHLSVTCRFSFSLNHARVRKEEIAVASVFDGTTEIYSTDPVKLPPRNDEQHYKLQDAAAQAARDWLTDHYPNWQDPAAYWD